MGRVINLIVVHCSATKKEQDVGVKEIKQWHLNQGWSDIGYHYVIRRNGKVEKGRADGIAGAHTKGFNSNSIGICMVGGLGANGKGEDNFAPEQKASLKKLLGELKTKYPSVKDVCGHRDLSPDANHDGVITKNEWVKDCPSFDVRAWVKETK